MTIPVIYDKNIAGYILTPGMKKEMCLQQKNGI